SLRSHFLIFSFFEASVKKIRPEGGFCSKLYRQVDNIRNQQPRLAGIRADEWVPVHHALLVYSIRMVSHKFAYLRQYIIMGHPDGGNVWEKS
ncbi:MAG: hypothetical protein K8R25_08355, partial [Methanosarcinales archaeon]|nr:hypothetical protein [Methanosarcinales archaeon]